MREIKFRVLTDGIWKYATLDQITSQLGWEYGIPENVFSFHQESDEPKKQVCQFTGLVDKNGVEIYEGDIVKNLHFKSTAQVMWKECKPSSASEHYEDLEGFVSNLGEFVFEGIGGRTKAFYINEFEVIGNIYENPELLTTNNS